VSKTVPFLKFWLLMARTCGSIELEKDAVEESSQLDQPG